MSNMFNDLIIRKQVQNKAIEDRYARHREIGKIFGDYCESHRGDLEELFEVVEIQSRQYTSSEDWHFEFCIAQSRKEYRSNHVCSRIYYWNNKLHVSSYNQIEISKDFEFNPNMNTTQLTRVMKNALRFAVDRGYQLPKEGVAR